MAVSIPICNMALGELRAQPIADIVEQSLEARECARYYPQCLAVLLERHDWSFATKIASLALLYTNPRIDEWLYAYGLPADFADVKRVLPSLTASNYPFCVPRNATVPYIIEAGVLYTSVENARLEYSPSAIPDARMTAMFIEALTIALAAKLAVPIRDSRETKGELLKQAEVMAQRAIADDRNRQPQREEQSDEVADARHGSRDCWGGSGSSVYSPGGGAYLGDGDQQLVEG